MMWNLDKRYNNMFLWNAVQVFTLDDKQKVVLVVDGAREDVIKQQAELIE